MDKLELYNAVRSVPEKAKKPITGGRLNGMTDINPMWRIKTLTEQFGPCGQGWYYEIKDKWIEKEHDTEITANVMIELYVLYDGEWSKPIVGIGGSMLSTTQRGGVYVNDECYKMALTDAISVACKALGVGADVYWNKDNTKYNDVKRENMANDNSNNNSNHNQNRKINNAQVATIVSRAEESGTQLKDILHHYKIDTVADMTESMFNQALAIMDKAAAKAANTAAG